MAWTSRPARYQPSKVRMAKLWRRSCRRGRQRGSEDEAGSSSYLVEGPIDVGLQELGSSDGHEKIGRRSRP